MKVALLLITLGAVCGPSFGFDWTRTRRLLRDFRNFEALMDLEERAAERKCSAPADVVFVLDRSRSIYPPDFEKGKRFVQDVIRLFDPKTSRFGAITFARGATVEFGLQTYGFDQQATLTAIGNLDQRTAIGDQTETWAALELLYKQVLQRSNWREGVEPAVVLITDGASQQSERTAREARNAHERGIKIVAIGIGNDVKESELRAIASNPDSENMMLLDNWNEALNKIKGNIATKVCPSNIENCEHNKPLDVVFSVSDHADVQESQMSFRLISSVMSKATIGPGSIQFGLARRECGWDQIALNELDTVEGFSSAFATRIQSFSSLTRRLTYLQREAFTPATGDQPNANNVAVIFIDRKSDIDQAARAQARRMRNVHIIVLAGNGVTAADVSDLADPSDVITFSSYSQIMGVSKQVTDRLCAALGRP